MCNGWVGACRSGMWPHAAHEAQGTHARAKMHEDLQILHVLMGMGCGDEPQKTAGAYLLLGRRAPTICGVARHGHSQSRRACA